MDPWPSAPEIARGSESPDEAVTIGSSRPVRPHCLHAALDAGPDTWGVWGDTARPERPTIRKARRSAAYVTSRLGHAATMRPVVAVPAMGCLAWLPSHRAAGSAPSHMVGGTSEGIVTR